MTGMRLSQRLDAYIRAVVSLLREDYDSIDECEQGVIPTHADVLTRIVNGSALTDNDVACLCELATEMLQAKSFAF